MEKYCGLASRFGRSGKRLAGPHFVTKMVKLQGNSQPIPYSRPMRPLPPIQYDHDRLNFAVRLLLDYRFGAGREQRVREAILQLPKHTRFTRIVEPLNEIMRVAKQSPNKALELIEPVARERIRLEKERRAATPIITRKRDILRVNTARYRQRTKYALLTEEIRLQRKFSKEEAKAFLDKRKKLWKMRQEQFRNEHPELKYQDALAQFADILDEEVKLKYERALVSGPIKKRST